MRLGPMAESRLYKTAHEGSFATIEVARYPNSCHSIRLSHLPPGLCCKSLLSCRPFHDVRHKGAPDTVNEIETIIDRICRASVCASSIVAPSSSLNAILNPATLGSIARNGHRVLLRIGGAGAGRFR